MYFNSETKKKTLIQFIENKNFKSKFLHYSKQYILNVIRKTEYKSVLSSDNF